MTLRDNAESFRLMFANNPLPMWVYDFETLKFINVNEAAVRHYGFSKDEFLNLTIADIRPPDFSAQFDPDQGRAKKGAQTPHAI